MKKIKFGFLLESGHKNFGNLDNWYNKLLIDNFNIEIVDYKIADFVLYSDKKRNERIAWKIPPKAIRIFLTGENEHPDFNESDYALTHDYIENDRHIRLPLLRHWIGDWALKPRNWEGLSKGKNRFCNFIYSNPAAPERIEFFNLLSRYKRVDSAGKVLNNMGNSFDENPDRTYDENKIELQRLYKFTIAFENSSYPGYSTEKLIHPLMAGSIPIYWGDPEIENDINPDCFINVHHFNTFYEVIERIKEIDNDETLWEKYVTAPVFKNNVLPDHFKEEKFIRFFDRIFINKKHHIPIALKRKQFRKFKKERQKGDYCKLLKNRVESAMLKLIVFVSTHFKKPLIKLLKKMHLY